MKILIASATYPPAYNGQATFIANLAEGLAKRGNEVSVVTTLARGQSRQVEQNGVHVFSLSSVELKPLHEEAYMNLLPGRQVRQAFELFRPEIVHLHDHYPLSESVLRYARRHGLPVVGTNHFVPENLAPYVPLLPGLKAWFSRLMWWWMKRVYDGLDLVTAPSATAVDILKSQGVKAPLCAVSCGVSFERFHVDGGNDRRAIRRRYGLDEKQTAFLFVGRVDAEKKVDVLIRAVRKLSRPDIQLVVTGNGAALRGYQDLARVLGIQDQVHFTGFVSREDLPCLLNSVDVFSMPSEAELLSIASLEAMASGLPLLLARSRALPELVDQGENGYLFEPGDVDDAARCMALLADHPERWGDMGAASLEKVQEHNLERVLQRYEQLYAACLPGRGHPAA
jgi:glycosyltransferase involved in cell wall biosynthesis